MRETYLSQRAIDLKPSGIRKFFDIVATMQDVISLGIGEPDFTTPRPILDAGIRSLQNGETHYTSNAGTIELRSALSEHIDRLYGVHYDAAKELTITVGGSEALYLSATALLNPGDEVIVLTPCFVSYQAEVFLAGGVPVEVPCRYENNFDVDPDEVRAAVTPRTRAILIGFPNNPTGAVASRECLLEIGRIAEEHDLIVLSDEIYDRLVYGGQHVCFPSLPGMRERTILLGGFSKDYAMTGWRIGFVAAPEPLMQGMLRIHQYTVMCAPTTSQQAACEAIKSGEPYVEEMVAEYDRRRKLIVNALNAIGLKTFEPKGAFYAFPYVADTGLDDDTFANRLLKEERVAVVPGTSFGKGGEGFVRCSYATAYDKIEEALERIDHFVKNI
jgi:aminotransferase